MCALSRTSPTLFQVCKSHAAPLCCGVWHVGILVIPNTRFGKPFRSPFRHYRGGQGAGAGTQHCYSVTVRPSQAENEVCAFSCLCICAFWRDIGCGMVFRAACHGAWFGLEPRGAGFVFVRSRLLRFSFPRRAFASIDPTSDVQNAKRTSEISPRTSKNYYSSVVYCHCQVSSETRERDGAACPCSDDPHVVVVAAPWRRLASCPQVKQKPTAGRALFGSALLGSHAAAQSHAPPQKARVGEVAGTYSSGSRWNGASMSSTRRASG
jgi:hypothetical protein